MIPSVTPSTAETLTRGTPTGGAITLEGVPTYLEIDADGNGLFEWLQVNVPVKVAHAGEYHFDAYLVFNDGEHWLPTHGLDTVRERAQFLTHTRLEAGTQMVAMYFDGQYLHYAELDGPYTIDVYVYESGIQDPSDSIRFSTQAYTSADFQGLLIENLSLSDSGVDVDDIPGYEALRVSAHLNMIAAGTVGGQAILFGGDMRLQTLELPAIQLDAGPQTVEIDFSGETIFGSRVDGPYHVNVSLRDQYFPASDQSYTTTPYTHDQFQAPIAHFTNYTGEVGNDLNGDGLYDELLISMQIVTRIPGSYRIVSLIKDKYDDSFGTYSDEITLSDTLPQIVTLHFTGTDITKHGVDGPYRVIVVVEENDPPDPYRDHEELDGLIYETRAYLVTAFQQSAARLNGVVTDSGMDTDGDGEYDVLRVRVGVSVLQAGEYVVSASLFDGPGHGLATVQTEAVFLEPGDHMVDVDFSGAMLRASKTNGRYMVGFDLYQAGGDRIDFRFADYFTAAYLYTAFRATDPMLSEDFSDHGVDTNGNGLYENLTINMKVSIAKAGQYDFNAALSEANGEEIFRAVGTQYLEVGEQWIALEFDGRYIYGQQANGPYQMGSFSLYSNDPEQVLGEGLTIYTTGVYDWHEFEPGVSISGSVVSAAGEPLNNVLVFISGFDTDYSDASGRYRLTALDTGPITIDIDSTQGAWQIWVGGELETVGSNVTVLAVVGTPIEVNFVKVPYSQERIYACE